MLSVPYIKQPDEESCALACYAMIAKYFFLETSFEDVAKISDWEKGYIIWAFKFWLWIMDRGVRITEYDPLDYMSWASQGIEGLKKSVSEKEFEYYKAHTKNLESYATDILKVVHHPNFTMHQEKPIYEELTNAINNRKPCEVVLNAGALKNADWFSLHRVVVLDADNDSVIFNDPFYGEQLVVEKDLFIKSWLDLSEPELTIYEL
ncbi:MAG TPA: cysteine peptidase family C39 domain-containing protein [Patescibacteria group bacterium]|nr:cysteine peptidase family C39 domain-containing protein [Patescibacteria group bacterium]